MPVTPHVKYDKHTGMIHVLLTSKAPHDEPLAVDGLAKVDRVVDVSANMRMQTAFSNLNHKFVDISE